MLFVEPRFVVFFAVVCVVHWTLRRDTSRKLWLLAASYAFYAAWDWRFLSLILISTLIDYTVGLGLWRSTIARNRKRWLAVSLIGNLGILGFFKYYNFFAESALALGDRMGLPVGLSTLNIILPVGISFYTFQTLSYSIDVYRRKLEPTRSVLDLALFVGFFPQLVAGPIVRAAEFLPQLRTRRTFAGVDVRACLTLFLIGYFKKACLSDNLAPIVDAYFAAPAEYAAMTAWIAVPLYAVQIYCDFSGYTDMAIACAGLLGYRLCTNFNFPYFAANVTEFWRRWHISLSTWLRDYLYVPLGGSRGSSPRLYRNLMITMVLGGLWHGAAWHFMIWGALHGVALIAHKEWCRRMTPRDGVVVARSVLGRASAMLGPFLTFYWVCLAWVFFRAPDTATALTVAKAFVCLQGTGHRTLGTQMVWILPCLAIAHWAFYKRFFVERLQQMADWAFAGSYSVATCLVIAFVPTNVQAFIYFQF